MHTSRQALVLLLLLTVAACAADTTSPPGTGSARVAVSIGALSAEDVADVAITVSGPGIESELLRTLSRNSEGDFIGTVAAIPAGSERSLRAAARDARGAALYSGEVAHVAVVAGEQVAVQLLLQQLEAPLPFSNGAPRFSALVASAMRVAPGEPVELGAVADDIDGDELRYKWSADAGVFGDGDDSWTTWTAPILPGIYTLEVSAEDAQGASARAAFDIEVGAADGTGAALLTIDLNTAPEVYNLVPRPSLIAVGERTALLLEVADAEEDAIVERWSSDCDGVFGRDGGIGWFELSALPDSGECVVEVAVSDERGGNNYGSVTLQAGSPLEFEALVRATVPQLVITEVMANPSVLSDREGEWFEVHNPDLEEVALEGCVIRDARGATHTVSGPLQIPAAGTVVLANSGRAAPRVDYTYSGVELNNSDESLSLSCAGILVDEVEWESSRPGTSWGLDAAGFAMRPPAAAGAVGDGVAWCYAAESASYGGEGGDRGSPGAVNPSC